MSDKPFAFVLMPFGEEHADVYNLGIKSTVEAAGMIAQRVDEQIFHREGILQRIYNQIEAADLIIADMSGRNPNVFYEVGYSHGKSKLCILLTKDADDIPFDLKRHRHIVYGSIRDLKSKLAVDLDAVRTELTARANPVSVDLVAMYGSLEKTEWVATAKTTIILDLYNRTESMSPDIDAIYLDAPVGWNFTQDKTPCPRTPDRFFGDTLRWQRHFLRTPVPRLAKGGWAQIALVGYNYPWTSSGGEVLQEKYKLAAAMRVRVSTARGNFNSTINLNLEVEEL